MIPCDNPDRDEEEQFQNFQANHKIHPIIKTQKQTILSHQNKNQNRNPSSRTLSFCTADTTIRHPSTSKQNPMQVQKIQSPTNFPNFQEFQNFQNQDLSQDEDIQVEGPSFLPIKKRRLKESEEREKMYYAAASSQNKSVLTANQIIEFEKDNSEQWWYHANRQYPTATVNNNNNNNNASARRVNNSANASVPANVPPTTPNDLEEASSRNLPEKPNYHRDDPRSEDYQKWLRCFYSSASNRSLSSNTLLSRLRLVNPLQYGIFPPWISPAKLKQWDITQPIPILSRSEYNQLDLQVSSDDLSDLNHTNSTQQSPTKSHPPSASASFTSNSNHYETFE